MNAIRAGFVWAAACAALAGVRSTAAAEVLGPAAIVGSVRDGGGHPVAGALVVASGPASREAITSAAGLVTLQALPLGSYSVSVTRTGFAPSGTQVRLTDMHGGPTLVRLRIAPASFADLHGAGNAIDTVTLAPNSDSLSYAVENSADGNVVPAANTVGAAPVLLGTAPNETRVELDGIPLAGGSRLTASHLRSALGLTNVQLVRAPVTVSSTLRDAIGGVIDYRTADVDAGAALGAEIGYDSTFGAFEHVRANEQAGKLGILTDIVAGNGENRSQTYKVRYAFSPGTALALAQYGLQSTATLGTQYVTANAPAFAADLRAAVGAGTLEARTFGSSSSVSLSAFATSSSGGGESARTRGTQVRYTVPAGDSSLVVGFDRRSDDAWNIRRTYTTATARADIALSASSRIEIGDAYGGGSSLRPRHDPHIAFALRSSPRTTLRLAAGSAYATAPDALVLRNGGNVAVTRAPETSVGYRLGIEEGLSDGDRAWVSLDALRRFDRFAKAWAARSSGIEVGYERASVPGRFGGLAYVRMQRATAYGPAQPLARDAEYVPGGASASTFAGDPFTKARAAITYATAGNSFDAGLTYLGANNAFVSQGVVLGGAHARVTLGNLVDIGVGVENLFGTVVRDPALASLYVPREFTLTLGRFSGP